MAFGITSPPTKGPKVKALQQRLKKNRFGDFMKSAKIDGEYGPLTAAAVARSKYWMGFPASKINKIAGNSFMKMLKSGKLPVTYRLRRRRRLNLYYKGKTNNSKRAAILKTAISQIGVKENPAGSNRVKYSEWYGMIGPWCAMFVSWCYAKHGLGKKFHYAYTPYVVANARSNKNSLYVTNNPQPGDLVLYDWDKDGKADHIGIYEKAIAKGVFQAIEGNTSVGNDSNGGEVMRRKRKTSSVICFVRVRM